MKKRTAPYQERVKELLLYDSSAGAFLWKKNNKTAGCVRKDGYRVIRVDGVLYYAHQLAYIYEHGTMTDRFIDHINGVRDDNRINNLRCVSASVNAQNVKRINKRTLSGLLGVQKNHSGWQAVINLNSQRYCLGTFKDPQSAHEAYIAAKRKLHSGCTI